ncbi:CHAD domain-containing protein [Pseudodonghicola xiamenensis]|nr:CHAD domain-containing protein [Pseudodonghicola xiamenensis]
MRRVGESFALSGRIRGKALGKDVGALRLELEPEAPPVAFALLDQFDCPLGKSHRALIEAEGKLILLAAQAGGREQPAARSGHFIADLQPGPVGEALSDLSPLRSLLALGQGRMVVRRATLLDEEEKTQARAWLRRLEPDGPGAVVTLVELQYLRGYDLAFDQLRRRLRGAAPHIELEALAESLFPGTPAYEAKPQVPLAPGEPAARAAAALIGAHIAVARQNEGGVIADIDTEFLHDYRVSLRKVRSVLSLFRGVYDAALTDELKRAFSDLMAPTGRLRDLDVYLLERDLYFDLLPATLHSGLSAMFDLFARERAAEQAKLARRFGEQAYADQIGRLQRVFAEPDALAKGPMADYPVLGYARKLIWARYHKVCKLAAEITDKTPDNEVHALRIGCKKLRYLMEFFAPLFPASQMAPLIKPLKRLQDGLGLFNDYAVQQQSLRALLATPGADLRDDAEAIARSVDALIAILHQRQLEQRARLTDSFAGFDNAELRARFAAQFHDGGETA